MSEKDPQRITPMDDDVTSFVADEARLHALQGGGKLRVLPGTSLCSGLASGHRLQEGEIDVWLIFPFPRPMAVEVHTAQLQCKVL